MQPILHRPSSRTLAGIIFLLSFAAAPFAYAASGTISSPDQYAWGNIAGWINFAPVDSTVTVSDASLTGYAWSENDGWINLSPTEGGVTNSDGTLGGWAWDQSAGWVSFSGVTIDSSGTFHGEVTGSNGYAINFDCSTCDVVTDWRPATSDTTTTTNASPGAISGSSQPPIPPPNETIPSAYPFVPPGTEGEAGGSILHTVGPSSPDYSKPNTGSIAPRAFGRPSNSATSTASSTLRATLRRIALPVIVLSLLAIIAAVFWLLL
jgi:hypothetical protein